MHDHAPVAPQHPGLVDGVAAPGHRGVDQGEEPGGHDVHPAVLGAEAVGGLVRVQHRQAAQQRRRGDEAPQAPGCLGVDGVDDAGRDGQAEEIIEGLCHPPGGDVLAGEQVDDHRPHPCDGLVGPPGSSVDGANKVPGPETRRPTGSGRVSSRALTERPQRGSAVRSIDVIQLPLHHAETTNALRVPGLRSSITSARSSTTAWSHAGRPIPVKRQPGGARLSDQVSTMGPVRFDIPSRFIRRFRPRPENDRCPSPRVTARAHRLAPRAVAPPSQACPRRTAGNRPRTFASPDGRRTEAAPSGCRDGDATGAGVRAGRPPAR